jgi:nucleotide-binding universal stress UspA family protein
MPARRAAGTLGPMGAAMTTTVERGSLAGELCSKIVVGVDRSPESVEAARQAAVLADHAAEFTLLGTWTVPAPGVGFPGPGYSRKGEADLYRGACGQAVAAARRVVDGPEVGTKVVRGPAAKGLLEEASAERATLLVVGSHGQGRTRGVLAGSTVTEVVHKAPCSVLVVRPAESFPRRIVVGVDGSPESEAAYAVARALADRFGGNVWPVVAHGGEDLDVGRVERIVGYRRDDQPGDPVSALVAASADADLLVVGSRSVHGLKALRSVSERVAHRAGCSTLIVRPGSTP